jgi:hypothetical protein
MPAFMNEKRRNECRERRERSFVFFYVWRRREIVTISEALERAFVEKLPLILDKLFFVSNFYSKSQQNKYSI